MPGRFLSTIKNDRGQPCSMKYPGGHPGMGDVLPETSPTRFYPPEGRDH